MSQEQDAEFAAMMAVFSSLQALNEDAQGRVLEYVTSRLNIGQKPRQAVSATSTPTLEPQVTDEIEVERVIPSNFGSFAELYDASQPKTQSDKALVGGYWVQVCQGGESFDAFSINKELKNLGEGVLNITSALDSLKAQKPALALQMKKAGKSRQARKTYKVTVAGIKFVEAMIGG
jgi:hypothetical protein